MTEKFAIPIKIKSRNQTDRLHWAVKSKIKKEYCLLIRNKMRLHKIKKLENNEKCIIAIISHRKRLLDYDNLDVKLLLDAMTQEKFIVDDAPKYIGKPIVEQHKTPKERTEIARFTRLP